MHDLFDVDYVGGRNTQLLDQLTVPPFTAVLVIVQGWSASRGVDGSLPLGGSGLSAVMHSVRLKVRPCGINCISGDGRVPGGVN